MLWRRCSEVEHAFLFPGTISGISKQDRERFLFVTQRANDIPCRVDNNELGELMKRNGGGIQERQYIFTWHKAKLWDSLQRDMVTATKLDGFKGNSTNSWRTRSSMANSHDSHVLPTKSQALERAIVLMPCLWASRHSGNKLLG